MNRMSRISRVAPQEMNFMNYLGEPSFMSRRARTEFHDLIRVS
jgi:hypothetical protein